MSVHHGDGGLGKLSSSGCNCDQQPKWSVRRKKRLNLPTSSESHKMG